MAAALAPQWHRPVTRGSARLLGDGDPALRAVVERRPRRAGRRRRPAAAAPPAHPARRTSTKFTEPGQFDRAPGPRGARAFVGVVELHVIQLTHDGVGGRRPRRRRGPRRARAASKSSRRASLRSASSSVSLAAMSRMLFRRFSTPLSCAFAAASTSAGVSSVVACGVFGHGGRSRRGGGAAARCAAPPSSARAVVGRGRGVRGVRVRARAALDDEGPVLVGFCGLVCHQVLGER